MKPVYTLSLKFTFISFLLLYFVYASFSQSFQDINAGLTGVGRSAAEWCDYDRDGDLDVLIS
jgi:hypothetical protein